MSIYWECGKFPMNSHTRRPNWTCQIRGSNLFFLRGHSKGFSPGTSITRGTSSHQNMSEWRSKDQASSTSFRLLIKKAWSWRMRFQHFTLIFHFQVINRRTMGSYKGQMRMSNVYGKNMVGTSRTDFMAWIVANWTVIEMLGTDRQDNMNYELSADYPHQPVILEQKDYLKWAKIWTKHAVTVGLVCVRIWGDTNEGGLAFLRLMEET